MILQLFLEGPMKKISLFFLIFLFSLFYVSQPVQAGECIDDTDCAQDEICVSGFCEVIDNGGAECIDDLDCMEGYFCDVDGFCAPAGGDVIVEDGGCSINPLGRGSMANHLSLAVSLLALSGMAVWRRNRSRICHPAKRDA